MAEYREAIEAALARVAEAGEGGEAYRHLAELLEEFSARFEAAKERRAGLDFEDLQLHAVRLLERDRGRRAPTGSASATCWSTSSRTPTGSSCG